MTSYLLSVCGHISLGAHRDNTYQLHQPLLSLLPLPISAPTSHTSHPNLEHPTLLHHTPYPNPSVPYQSYSPYPLAPIPHSPMSTFTWILLQCLVFYKWELTNCMFCQWAKDPWSYFSLFLSHSSSLLMSVMEPVHYIIHVGLTA